MEWYWWVLLFLALGVAGAFIEEREFRAQHRAPGSRTLSETGSAMLCDICGDPLGMAEATIVAPSEMRLLAYNGYGEIVPMLAALPLSERRSKFQFLAYANETDWALCGPCHRKARPYMADANPGRMSQSDLDEVYDFGLKPFFEAAAELDGVRPKPVRPTRASERVMVRCPKCRLGHRLPKNRRGRVVCAKCGTSFPANTRA